MCRNHDHSHGDVNDYKKAVAEYRKTFPSKQDVIDHTPDPAVRDMIVHMGKWVLKRPLTVSTSRNPIAVLVWLGYVAVFVIWDPVKSQRRVPKDFAVLTRI